MGTHPARRLWAALEPLHDVVYFADGVRPAGIALGGLLLAASIYLIVT